MRMLETVLIGHYSAFDVDMSSTFMHDSWQGPGSKTMHGSLRLAFAHRPSNVGCCVLIACSSATQGICPTGVGTSTCYMFSSRVEAGGLVLGYSCPLPMSVREGGEIDFGSGLHRLVEVMSQLHASQLRRRTWFKPFGCLEMALGRCFARGREGKGSSVDVLLVDIGNIEVVRMHLPASPTQWAGGRSAWADRRRSRADAAVARAVHRTAEVLQDI